jgi:hypothetical protein
MRLPYRLARARWIQNTIARLAALRATADWQAAYSPRRGTAAGLCKQRDDLVRRGLRAWTNGDLDALEAVLDPG